jgi:EmrB/QacA subfamily drug resistance transporter
VGVRAEAAAVSRKSVGLRSERGPLLAALMLATALVALDQTIIATAVPSIVDDLGGFSQFPWVFSIYLLVQAVSTPIYGRLADLLGRKPVILTGIGLFLLGSVLCAVAWSMPALIFFRALQGLGAGAVQPMSQTIAGDVYSLAERAKVQGYIAGVWGVMSVVGPTLGGGLSEFVHWRSIFWINVPLGLVAMWLVRRNLTEHQQGTRGAIDYLGAALLSSGCALLILGLLEGGQVWAWTSAISVAVLMGGVTLLVCFVLVERRVGQPILPLWVFTRRILLASSLVAVGVGAIVLGLSSYVPTFAQGVLGASPITAGFALATLTLGWPLASAFAGRLYLRIGFRLTALIGSALAVLGTVFVPVAAAWGSLASLAAACFVVGSGMGLIAAPTLIAAQASVGWAERGVVTGNNMFFRSLGSAVAVAIFGAVANAVLARADPAGQQLADASGAVFVGVAVVAVVMVLAVAAMPGRPGAPASGRSPA